jgi:hypothetical protein
MKRIEIGRAAVSFLSKAQWWMSHEKKKSVVVGWLKSFDVCGRISKALLVRARDFALVPIRLAVHELHASIAYS